MKKISRAKIQKIIELIKNRYNPEKIILFGSFVWGNPNENSDLDLFLIKKTKERRYKRQVKVRRLIKGEIPVDILVYTPQEVKKRLAMGDFFIEDIINKGKTLYESTSK